MTSRAQFNTKSPTIKRILREAAELSTNPSPDYTAIPLEDNLFEWHFTLRGPPGSDTPTSTSTNPNPTSITNTSTTSSPSPGGPYAHGIYHGRIILPPEYPLRPPSFRFLTPSGRFEANREICLSISGHHEETWQPAWGLRTALIALRAFMETDARGQLGGLECTEAVRRELATRSRSWRCGVCGTKRNEEIMAECERAAAATENKAPEAEVPKELRMGWKDEMQGSKTTSGTETGSADTKKDADEDSESAELAEGFVQTAPMIPITTDVQYPPARPAQTVPQPTATIPLQQRQAVRAAQPAVAVRRRNIRSIDFWLDYLIPSVAACLIWQVLIFVYSKLV